MKKNAPSKFAMEWEAHEYEHKERSADWFWAAGIVTVGAALTAIILHNAIFGILILVSAFTLALFINREPGIVDVRVDEKGITRGRVHYPYETLHSFTIDIEHSHPKILLRSHKFFLPLIVIPLNPEVNTHELAEQLSRFIEEENHSLTLVEKLLEFLGF